MTITLRKLALSAFLSVAALLAVSLTSCSSTYDDNVGFKTGTHYEIRNDYYKPYTGTGKDNFGDIYTWTAQFSKLGDDKKKMNLQFLDEDLQPIVALTVTLKTNNSFDIDKKVIGSYTYSGNGTIDEIYTTISLIKDSTGTVPETTTYKFIKMEIP